MREHSWLDIEFYCILLEQDWHIVGEDRWWGVMILGEDFVNCGSREVFVRLLKNTDDSTSPSTKASTFDPPQSIRWPSILVSRLVLLICWANFLGVVRSSGVRRAISFFSCHISNRRQLIKIGGTKSQNFDLRPKSALLVPKLSFFNICSTGTGNIGHRYFVKCYL